MLLGHYLEHGASKSALARKLGVHRDTIHRWIRDGELDRNLDGEPVRYGPRRAVPTKLDACKVIIETRLAASRSYPPCGCWRRFVPPVSRAPSAGSTSARTCGRCSTASRTPWPYRAQTKGKVERPVRYLRDNFVYGRTFAHDADLDQQRRRWLDDIANVRVHATPRERPRERFDRDDRLLLHPLAPRPYTSVLVPDAAPPRTSTAPRPLVSVEKRPHAVHARLTGGLA